MSQVSAGLMAGLNEALEFSQGKDTEAVVHKSVRWSMSARSGPAPACLKARSLTASASLRARC